MFCLNPAERTYCFSVRLLNSLLGSTDRCDPSLNVVKGARKKKRPAYRRAPLDILFLLFYRFTGTLSQPTSPSFTAASFLDFARTNCL